MDSQKINQTFTLDDKNSIEISKNGGRIIKLVLNNVTVIQATEPYNQLGTGSYLMYPWVNRLAVQHHSYKPIFLDGNGLPIHGLVANLQNSIDYIQHQQQKSLKIVCKPINPSVPKFTLIYTLSQNKLTVDFVIDSDQFQEPVCFGFHPFLQLDSQKIVDCSIQSNIQTNLKLHESLLPVYPFVKQEITISSQNKYDSLFEKAGMGFLRLRSQKLGKQVEIRSEDMHFWQVYTPADGCRIAVQPMTFCGNLYGIYNVNIFGKLPSKGGFEIQVR